MRDLAFVAFIVALLGLGFRRPFVFVLGYIYADIVSPQRLCYYLLNSVPLSLVFFVLAVAGWIAFDDKTGTRLTLRQMLMITLLGWCAWTTLHADFPVEAAEKWSWVWKALTFAIFLPFTLRTRLRIEAMLLFSILSVSSIVIVGGIKTLATGGGYGALNLMVDNNGGFYEGSIISAVAIAAIPIILVLAKHGTLFPSDWRVKLFAAALTFACLLIPVGTQARTGLICIALLAVLTIREAKRRVLWGSLMVVAAMIAIPLLPASYTQRMHTIEGYQSDESASTRIAVWGWTWNYVQDHPGGGGFNAYLQNKLTIKLKGAPGDPGETETAHDQARAYHSSYFEMLGEQGFFGLGLWLMLQIAGLFRMELLRRRFRRSTDPEEMWISPMATALQHGHLIYLVGALFVGIAFQPFVYILVAAEIGLDGWVRRARPRTVKAAFGGVRPAAA